jgi:hypothetical protein
MTLTKRHFLPIALGIVVLYFCYTSYILPYLGPMTPKELLDRFDKEGFIHGWMSQRKLVDMAESQRAKVVPELLKAMRHPRERVRALAALALGATRDKRDIRIRTALLAALKDKKAIVRAHAARGLRGIRVYEVVEPLIKILNDPSEEVQTAAHNTLKEITRMTWPLNRGAWEEWWQEDKRIFYVRED